MTKDEILQKVFEAVAQVPQTKDHGVCKLLKDGEIRYLCGQGMLFGTPTDEEARLAPGVFHKYFEDADVLPVSPSLPFTMENALEIDRLVPFCVGPDVLYVPVGKPPRGGSRCLLEIADRSGFSQSPIIEQLIMQRK